MDFSFLFRLSIKDVNIMNFSIFLKLFKLKIQYVKKKDKNVHFLFTLSVHKIYTYYIE